MKKKKYLYILAVIFLLLVAGWAVILYQLHSINKKSELYGIAYDGKAPEFTLTNQDGGQTSLTDLKGKVVLLFFGYTHCPDICPVTLSVINSAINNLENENDKVEAVFITVDPERDTPEKLKSYVSHFNNGFIGLTGSSDEIKEVAEAYRVFYTKEETDTEAGYLMGHTSSVLLIDEDGNFQVRYPQNRHDPKEIAKDIERIR